MFVEEREILVSERIKKLGMTYTEWYKSYGLDKTLIYEWRKGVRNDLSTENWQKLSKALDTSIDSLMKI